MIDWRDVGGKLRWGTLLIVLTWAGAVLLIGVVHGAIIWTAMNWQSDGPPPSEASAAIVVDLDPVAVSADAPPQDVAPGPQVTESQPEPAPDVKTPDDATDPLPPEPVKQPDLALPDVPPPEVKPDPPPPEPVKQPDPPPNVPIRPTPEPEIKPPDAPKMLVEADAVLPPPAVVPPPVQKPVEKKLSPPKKSGAERKKPIDPTKPKHDQTTAPPASKALRAPTTAAPRLGSSIAPSAAALNEWGSEVRNYIARHQRPCAPGVVGVTKVAFKVGRSGQVTSVHVIESSGNTVEDGEAVALVERSNPVPAPTFEILAGVSMTAPIRCKS